MSSHIKDIRIGQDTISESSPVYFIGELSANHGGNIETAIASIRAIKDSGANAVKLQTYRAESLTLDVDSPDFHIAQGSVWDNRSYFNLYKQAAMPWEWHHRLFSEAHDIGIPIFSTPFDSDGVALLQSLNSIAYKVASYEIRHIPLIEEIAKTGKPLIISTGIADHDDIQLAIDTCYKAGNTDIILMKCTSSYPADYSDLNLQDITTLRNIFKVHVGFSDHSYSDDLSILSSAPIVATTLGATIIEKHFILDKGIKTADSHFSLNPQELKATISSVRAAEKGLNTGAPTQEQCSKLPHNQQYKWSGKLLAQTGGRSIYVSQDIPLGGTINTNNISIVRPGLSLHPKHYYSILGKQVNKSLTRGSRLNLNDIQS